MDRHLNLHGIQRRASVVLTEEDETKKEVNRISRELKNAILSKSMPAPSRSRSGSILKNVNPEVTDVEKGEMARAVSAHRRRHSVHAAKKNGTWADIFLSVAASEIGIAGVITFKESGPIDAEYFYNLIPKAVVMQDLVYKELLAVYNSFKYWGTKLFLGRRIYISMTNTEALKLLKSAKINSKVVSPQKSLIWKEINDICHRQCIDIRVSLNDEPTETMVYYLSQNHQPQMKRKFDIALRDLDKSKDGYEFVAIERLFPPSFV